MRDATAFGLKTIESLLDAEPDHAGLRLAAARGFTQYAFAFLQSEADYVEEADYAQAKHMRQRAWRMFRRARAHGLRGLAIEHADFEARLRKDPAALLAKVDEDEVGLLVWTGLAWAAAVAINKEDAELAADVPLVEPLMQRALALDPGFGGGAIHDFLFSWYTGRPKSAGGDPDKGLAHHQEGLALAKGQRIAPLVAYAEGVCVKQQDQACFHKYLDEALAFDPDAVPEQRLANLVARKRALWLKGRVEDLFL
ncbi:MAG: TRAP transporter TatT component family protein [Myxococcales bacterium]|nr:TRAP transporter TatT component family protein [Myxococcales bacterium]